MKEDDENMTAYIQTGVQKGDYNDLYDLCKEDVEPIVPKVKHFIDKVASLIEI